MKRHTFGAVNRPGRQIKSFVEESTNVSSAPVISSSSFSVQDSNSPTVFVDIIPTAEEGNGEQDPFDILTVHKDGRVRRLSPDLETQRWSVRHSEIAKTPTHEVSACFLVEFEEAKNSLFKRRQDLAALALGNLADSGVDEPSILLLVSHPANTERIALKDVKVHMFSVPANVSAGLALDESQRMRHLVTINMPDAEGQEEFESAGLQWDFHSGSAGLSLSFARGFLNFDLSQYTPTVTSQFILPDEQFSSIMRISPQCVIGAGKSIVALYDTQYQSVQRSIGVDDISPGNSSATVFVGYFTKLGIAAAMKGSTLFAFDLGSSNTTSGFKRPRDGLLIDAIGRGIGSADAQWESASKKHCTETHMASLALASPEQVEKRNQLTADVEKSTKSKDADAFDSAVLTYFDTRTLHPSLPVHPELPVFLLSKIFSLEEENATDNMSASSNLRLTVLLWPTATCNWLIHMGHLCLSNIEIALRRSFKPRILPSLPTGTFIQALIDSDPSLRHLNQVIQGPVLIDAPDLVYALKNFLDMARSCSVTLEETAKTLTNTTDPNPSALPRDTDLPPPESHPETTLPSIFRGLNATLQKLHSHPLSTVTASLRSLSKPDLIAMIHHLRLSLATGGYTSRFTENPPTPISPSQTKPRLSLQTISDLLSASVDAIGPSGWISASTSTSASGPASASEDTDLHLAELDLINDMQSEISAAVAGVEEASFLKGILREYLRFADTRGSGSGRKQHPVPSAGAGTGIKDADAPPQVRHEKLNGAELLVFPGLEDGIDDASGKMLPLSLKAPGADVSRTKIKKGTGEVKTRSSREIGHLRRKQGGEYSFERLVL